VFATCFFRFFFILTVKSLGYYNEMKISYLATTCHVFATILIIVSYYYTISFSS